MRVLLATTWNTACGIAEHSAMLKEFVEAADRSIELVPDPAALDPRHAAARLQTEPFDLVHLNYHAALHSRWTPDLIGPWRPPVVVTYHDTGYPMPEQALGVCHAATAAVIHEPDTGERLPRARYWRQGVLPSVMPWVYDYGTRHGRHGRPLLGTCGFGFPWKNYPMIAAATAEAGWGLVIIGQIDEAQAQQILAANLDTVLSTAFMPREILLARLAGCDATAFIYTCANTGTSGAIRLGIAARKPVIANADCRQFRDLHDTGTAIRWVKNGSHAALVDGLRTCPIQRIDPGVVWLAEQDSWPKLGAQYAALYHEVTG